jgi:hypothetical protein
MPHTANGWEETVSVTVRVRLSTHDGKPRHTSELETALAATVEAVLGHITGTRPALEIALAPSRYELLPGWTVEPTEENAEVA